VWRRSGRLGGLPPPKAGPGQGLWPWWNGPTHLVFLFSCGRPEAGRTRRRDGEGVSGTPHRPRPKGPGLHRRRLRRRRPRPMNRPEHSSAPLPRFARRVCHPERSRGVWPLTWPFVPHSLARVRHGGPRRRVRLAVEPRQARPARVPWPAALRGCCCSPFISRRCGMLFPLTRMASGISL